MTNTETPPLPATATALDPGDPRHLFARAVATAGPVIAAVGDDQLDQPTPCDGLTVRDLLEHLVMVVRRVAAAGRADEPSTWPTDAPDVRGGGWYAAWTEGAHAVQAAWTDDALLDRPTELPWTTITGAEVLGTYTNEVVVHTWDLARATGQSPVWGADVLAAAEAAIRRELPMADRGALWAGFAANLPEGVPWEDPFGNAVPVADDAPAIDRLVAWTGRRP